MAPLPKPTLGALMRALRVRYGLTLKEMSTRTGVPFSTLSKVEHDRLTLTYDKLQMISERLNIRMSELFAELEGAAPAVANSRRSVGTLATALSITTPNYDYYYMSPELRNKDMIPIISRVKAQSLEEFGEMVRHDGQEFLYVLEGELVVHTEFYDPVTLKPGEAAYIDSKMGHAYVVAEGFDHALALCVCSSTQEELLGNAVRQTADAPAHGKPLPIQSQTTPKKSPVRIQRPALPSPAGAPRPRGA